MTYCNGETSVVRPDLTSPGAYLILFLGESLISQPSGEVHTPVWSQTFMSPVGHSDPLYEGSPMEDAVLRNLRLENLRRAIAGLDVQDQNLLSLRYGEELTMEEIGQIYGISKMAASKRLKKLYQKLEDSVL